jgi:hypothetical protein
MHRRTNRLRAREEQVGIALKLTSFAFWGALSPCLAVHRREGRAIDGIGGLQSGIFESDGQQTIAGMVWRRGKGASHL